MYSHAQMLDLCVGQRRDRQWRRLALPWQWVVQVRIRQEAKRIYGGQSKAWTQPRWYWILIILDMFGSVIAQRLQSKSEFSEKAFLNNSWQRRAKLVENEPPFASSCMEICHQHIIVWCFMTFHGWMTHDNSCHLGKPKTGYMETVICRIVKALEIHFPSWLRYKIGEKTVQVQLRNEQASWRATPHVSWILKVAWCFERWIQRKTTDTQDCDQSSEWIHTFVLCSLQFMHSVVTLY